MFLFFKFVQDNQKWKVVTKNKMDNPRFIDEGDIPMLHQNDDYDDYNTPNTSRIDETSFTVRDATEATSTIRLRQKLKRDKLTALYRHLNKTGNLDLIDLDRFKLTTVIKKWSQFSSFTTVLRGFLYQNKRASFLHQKP